MADDEHQAEPVPAEGVADEATQDQSAAEQPAGLEPASTAPQQADAAGAGEPRSRPMTGRSFRGSQHDAGDATHRSTLTSSTAADYDGEVFGMSPQASSLATGSTSRPLSAVRDARGSRPNSAAIAAQIEGFDNDFLLRPDDPAHLLLEEVPEADGRDDDDDDDGAGSSGAGPSMEGTLLSAQQEQAALQEQNDALQRRARQVLEQRNKGRVAVNRDLSRLDGAAARCRSALKLWSDLREERERVAAHYQVTVFDMKAALEGRIRRSEDIAATFAHFKREVALAAEHSKTGRPVADKLLEELEEKDHAVEEEVQRVRLKNIHLANALKKLEATIRDKEQLAEGLHLIDFEQLKIESQSLNEKIEERNEELIKLRKKTTVTVQILTHMKEKLQFVEAANARLQGELDRLEAALAGRRDELAALKASRDRLRQQGRALKEGSVFVANPMLLHDMQVHKEKRDDLMVEIEQLQQQHAAALAAAPLAGSRLGSSGRAGRLTNSRAGPGSTAAGSPSTGKPLALL